jgi:hypothetical protein
MTVTIHASSQPLKEATMRKMLLAAVLGTIAIVPASASAQGYRAGPSHVTSSFGINIVVRDALKMVQHHPLPARHLSPRPWPRQFEPYPTRWRFGHHARGWRWHNSWRPAPHHFHGNRGGHRGWFDAPDRPSLRDGHRGHRAHAPHWPGRGGPHAPRQRSGPPMAASRR